MAAERRVFSEVKVANHQQVLLWPVKPLRTKKMEPIPIEDDLKE